MTNPSNGGAEIPARKKLDLPLNQPVNAKILRDRPYEGENRYGKFFMWSFEIEGEEMVYFPEKETHQSLLALQLKAGDVVSLNRTAVQNGKKILSKVAVDVLSRASKGTPARSADGDAVGLPDDGFKDLMKTCVQEAVDIVKEVNTIPWQNEDVRSLAVTLFIQRVRS